MTSLSGLASAASSDNQEGALSFYSKPKSTASQMAGSDPDAKAVTEAAAPATAVAEAAPATQAVAATAPVLKAPPVKQAAAPRLDLSLPPSVGVGAGTSFGVGSGVAATNLEDSEASLAYIRQMVGTALQISPEMKQADANWEAAKGDVDQAKGARWPQVQVSAASKSWQSKKSEDYDNSGSTTVQMTTPIYDFGAISHAIDSREKTANAQEEAMALSEVTVAYNTATSVVELAHQQQSLEISDRYVARMRELVSMLSQIAEVDPGRSSEVTQARSRLLQAETTRDSVQAKLQEVRTSLAKLVGEDVTVPASAKWDWTPMPMEEALAQLEDTPAMRQARWEKEAALANADSVKSSRMPKLNWVVGRSAGGNMLNNDVPWSTGLAVEWNAFSGGSASAAQRAAYSRASAAEQKMEATRRTSEYTIRSLAEQRDLSASRANDYKSLLVESDRVRKMFYDQWYHLGKRTLLDVLIAENEYYTHQIEATDTYYSAKASDLRIRAETSGLLAWLAPGSH
ncbi:TolC family protein [Pseudomonas nitroreducens]|uniref:TolC family protein n=1 Tax=Pseudomonas nitroreducens TaxID=46680 RepID=UPI00265B5A5D|nr:TolC family protein [Pseudomonas nitroreducens]MCP1648834.1 adhesin transport system outer membrane protein [Pseudomonas nitroreducens]MCP1685205.1 adhesin transport system outer membrane protein [Pseudomonas nitroreducens]